MSTAECTAGSTAQGIKDGVAEGTTQVTVDGISESTASVQSVCPETTTYPLQLDTLPNR